MGTSDNSAFDENRKDFWNRAYAKYKERHSHTQTWLETYGDTLTSPSRILDMGCGIGTTAEYLISKGHTVTAIDISEEALIRLSSRVPGVETKNLDFTLGLPWKEATFDHIVADLCLHYFDIETTKRVVNDVLRVLKPGGFLFTRVNSTEDTVYGYGEGIEVQNNFFLNDGHYKRFFNRESINEVFKVFELVSISTGTIDSSRGPKHLYEIAGKKQNSARTGNTA